MFRKSLVLAAVRISKMQAIIGIAPKAAAVPLSANFHYSTPHELCKKNFPPLDPRCTPRRESDSTLIAEAECE